jgi:hypothetical protein
MSELSIHELEAQHGEVLPEREALGTFTKTVTIVHGIHQNTHAVALTFGGNHSSSSADAVSSVVVS